MDIVHRAVHRGQVVVQKRLQRAHRQLAGGIGDGDDGLFPAAEQLKLLPPAGAGVGAWIALQQRIQHCLAVHAEAHPVDGLKLQRLVVQVHQLHQRIAGLFRLGRTLLLLIVGLGGGKGVVSVAHGKEQEGFSLCVITALKLALIGQRAQRRRPPQTSAPPP